MENCIWEKVVVALKPVKSGKTAGVDCILPEFLKFLGPKGSTWITSFFSSVKNNNVVF